MIMSNIMSALRKKYESEIESARANIEVYMTNPSGIGEHPDIVAAVDSEMVKLADAEDKLESLESNYPNLPNSQYLSEGHANFSPDAQLDLFETPRNYDKDDAIEGE
tara:strand:+ start:7848 stop:8168 length:321 start_codon:yes stop_codon:yes gene_type:complete